MYSQKQRKELLAVTATRRREVIARATDYMARTGLKQQDMASRIGYAHPTFNLFLNQRYHVISANDSALVASLVDYMDRNPITPHTHATGALYETENVELIRRCFYRAHTQSCAYYFRGAPGCQKTFVLEHLIAELNLQESAKNERGACLVRARIGIRPGDLMKRVAMGIGAVQQGGIDRMLNNIRHELRRKKYLIVFDEAQFLSVDCLETVREMLDFGIGLLVAGSHQLEDTFSRLDMAQWRSRIRKGEGLPGLSEDEARRILRTELPKIAEKSMNEIIGHWTLRKDGRVDSSGCYETDYYQGEKRGYISARLLFLAIETVKLRKEEQAAKGATA